MARTPSPRRFVVRGVAEDGLPREVRARGVRTLPGRPAGIVVEVEEGAGDPRSAWVALARIVGPGAFVAPVLLDERGHELYPTGRVHVRFHEEPSAEVLGTFATRHGLGRAVPNRYQPLQSAFPVEGGYLPEVVAAVARDPAVRRAWEDVEAAFDRAG